jgi:uncharacterized protein YllA (UPF0747 family)
VEPGEYVEGAEKFGGNTYTLRILVTTNGTVNHFLDKNGESLQKNNLTQEEFEFLQSELAFAQDEFLPVIVMKPENVSPCCGAEIVMPQKVCSQCNKKITNP